MIEQIDHIGIAVKNLKETMRIYKDLLGLELIEEETIEEQKITLAKFLVGKVKIELVQSTHPESAIEKFIEKRGEGIHHIAFSVNLIDKEPRIGAGGAKIVFIHPKDMNGVLIELLEEKE